MREVPSRTGCAGVSAGLLVADRPRARTRLVAAGVPEAEVREVRVLARELVEHGLDAVLADQQVVVVGRRGVLLRRHGDAHLEPRAHQWEEHGQLVRPQRRDLVVAAHERNHRPGRIGVALHRVRDRDREPAHARAVHDVAEVDQPDRAVPVDEHVVLVGVVVDELVRELVQPHQPGRVAQVPAVRPTQRGMVEVRERPVDARDLALELGQIPRPVGPRVPVDPRQQPDRPPVLRVVGPAIRGTPGTARRCSSTRPRGSGPGCPRAV